MWKADSWKVEHFLCQRKNFVSKLYSGKNPPPPPLNFLPKHFNVLFIRGGKTSKCLFNLTKTATVAKPWKKKKCFSWTQNFCFGIVLPENPSCGLFSSTSRNQKKNFQTTPTSLDLGLILQTSSYNCHHDGRGHYWKSLCFHEIIQFREVYCDLMRITAQNVIINPIIWCVILVSDSHPNMAERSHLLYN